METWCGVTCCYSFAHNQIDNDTILSMDHDQPSQLGRATQDAKDGIIIDHKGTGIGHQKLKTGNTLGYHLVHSRFWRCLQVGNRHMKAIVNDSFAPGFGVPGLQRIRKGMAALLIGKIEDGGGAATGSSDRASLEIITGN